MKKKLLNRTIEINFKSILFVRCKGLILLETYSAVDKEKLTQCLPNFLKIEKEVTGDPYYSMYNLSLREDWKTSKKFCKFSGGKEDIPNGHTNVIDVSIHHADDVKGNGLPNGKTISSKA